MKRLIVSSEKMTEKEKKIKEVHDANVFAQQFIVDLQNVYNDMVSKLPAIKTLLDIQAVQIYQIMIEKIKKSIRAFNKTTITDKLNYMINQMISSENINQNVVAKKNDFLIKKISGYNKNIVEMAIDLKNSLILIKEKLEDLYERGKILGDKTKNLLNYHSKNSVLKRIRNIKTVIRWINNEDGLDTDLIGRLDKIIYGDIPEY